MFILNRRFSTIQKQNFNTRNAQSSEIDSITLQTTANYIKLTKLAKTCIW